MPKKKTKAQREHHYFRVIITYNDGETSGHKVFKDRAKAERWADRQKRSKVVKKTSVEEFTPNRARRFVGRPRKLVG